MTSPASRPPAIELRGVTKSFKVRGAAPVQAVRGIDLTVQPGEIVAFLGPNGAGKTTTIDMMLGLVPPDSGSARILGQTPRAAVEAGRISAVLQTGGLLPDLTVRDTVEVIAGLFPSTAPVEEVMGRAGIAGIAKRRVSKCSGGEQQRLRFALALLPEPDLLLLDEPTAGMDVSARREFWDTMQAEARSGRTVVFATHYLEEANAFAERIVLVARGRIVADGSTEEIRAQASGCQVSLDAPDDQSAAALAQRFGARPAVGRVEVLGRRVTLHVGYDDSDDLACAVLADPEASHLEITSGDLESAFIALTGEPDDGEPDGDRSGDPAGPDAGPDAGPGEGSAR